MIEREKELSGAGKKPVHEEEKDVHVGSQLKAATELTGFPVFPAGTKSLLSKYLTKDLWH